MIRIEHGMGWAQFVNGVIELQARVEALEEYNKPNMTIAPINETEWLDNLYDAAMKYRHALPAEARPAWLELVNVARRAP